MKVQTIDLYGALGRARGTEKAGTLTLYLHEDLTEMPQKRVRPAMLVIPGGGYEFVSQREGEPVAQQFFAQGYNCFVLNYDVAPFSYPVQLLEAGMAMIWLRRSAAALGIRRDRIAAIGFSAGGHLAGCTGVLWDDPALRAAFGDECNGIRPDALVLSYAVITGDKALAHGGSFDNFCGKTALREAYSLEKHVRAQCPPTFLWATSEDDCVPAENSLLMYAALKKAGVPAELHLYEKGWHGLSTVDLEVSDGEAVQRLHRVRSWIGEASSFLASHDFTVVTEAR